MPPKKRSRTTKKRKPRTTIGKNKSINIKIDLSRKSTGKKGVSVPAPRSQGSTVHVVNSGVNPHHPPQVNHADTMYAKQQSLHDAVMKRIDAMDSKINPPAAPSTPPASPKSSVIPAPLPSSNKSKRHERRKQKTSGNRFSLLQNNTDVDDELFITPAKGHEFLKEPGSPQASSSKRSPDDGNSVRLPIYNPKTQSENTWYCTTCKDHNFKTSPAFFKSYRAYHSHMTTTNAHKK